MFDHNSRYYNLGNLSYKAADGRHFIYKKRRFITGNESPQISRTAIVGDDGRLDLVASKTLSDPLQYWRIADANNAMDPFTLAVSGHKLVIPSITFPKPGQG